MMDEYVVDTADGPRRIEPKMHCSCAGFAEREIVGPINAALPPGRGVRPQATPGRVSGPLPLAYDRRIEEAGGVYLFLAASGAGDGHVAFVAPGGDLAGRTSVLELADQTRRDNMATFPDFASLDDVPRLGVSVGLGTIVSLSRGVAISWVTPSGPAPRASWPQRNHDPAWPATFIHRCPRPRILPMRPRPARLDAEG